MEYKAIARRFRPNRFSEVTGQDAIVKTLRNAALQKKASHAYLFTGIRGTGKTSLARIFAKALNCEALTLEGEPCNLCASCTEMMQGKSLDFIEIDGASNRGIDDIRNLNETLGYRAIKGRYKIYLIDEVHMLTKEAFNALLKSLEEPPLNVKFFFATTEVNKVLPTIISRCQRFDLTRISNHEIIKKLRQIAKEINIEIDDEALSLIAKLSEGSLRDAESLFDQISCSSNEAITANFILDTLGFVPKNDFFLLDQAFQQEDLTFAFKFASKLFLTGRDITYFLENLIEHYRNLMLIHLKHLQIEDAFISEEERKGYEASSKIYEQNHLIHILDYLSDLIHQSTRPTYKRIHLEMVLLHILQTRKRVSLDSILQKLSNMEGANIELGQELVSKKQEVLSAPVQEVKIIYESSSPKPIEEKVEEKDTESNKNLSLNIQEGVLEVKKIIPTHRYDTVLRFAQVELGATLKKN